MISKDRVKALQLDITAALRDVAAKHGIQMTGNRASYDDFEVRVNVKFTDGVAGDTTVQREQFAKFCNVYGLIASDYGRTFKYGSHEYKLVGFDLNKRRFPVQGVRVSNGKQYGLPATVVPAIRAGQR